MPRARTVLVACLTAALAACASYKADTNTAKGVLSGSVMQEADCRAKPDNSVWVVRDPDWDPEDGTCLRFYQAGLSARTPTVHIWFHGDRMYQTEAWEARVPDWYEDSADADRLQGFAEREARSYGIPYIRFGRPGVYGSSGFHKQRRLAEEAEIVNAALDALKARHGIERFVLSGQSGGGHVVASLLTKRDDIACAVITSGVVAVGMRARHHGWKQDITGYRSYFDPLDNVAEIRTDPRRRIFVVGDPRDRNTPFFTQEAYAKAVEAAGHEVALVRAEARGRAYHSLALTGFKVVQWCLEGVPADEIQARLPIPDRPDDD